MSNLSDEPAYPTVNKLADGHGGYTEWVDHGLTKRELFAAMAMQGLLACHTTVDLSLGTMVEYCVLDADALLAELAKENDDAEPTSS